MLQVWQGDAAPRTVQDAVPVCVSFSEITDDFSYLSPDSFILRFQPSQRLKEVETVLETLNLIDDGVPLALRALEEDPYRPVHRFFEGCEPNCELANWCVEALEAVM